jgi:hypothetical protein
MLPGPCGCLGLGISKVAERREKEGGKGKCTCMEALGKRQQLKNLRPQEQS